MRGAYRQPRKSTVSERKAMTVRRGSTRQGVSTALTLSSLEGPDECVATVGLSFGYNQMEQSKHSMSARTAVRLVIDVASRGGNTLLNVGPDASGLIPLLQMKCLEGMAEWMQVNQEALDRGMAVGKDVGVEPQGGKEDDYTSDWVRWLSDKKTLYAFVDGDEEQIRFAVPEKMAEKDVKMADGRPAPITKDGSSWALDAARLQDLPRPIVAVIDL